MYADLYPAEVARGASHISSMLRPESLATAVTEVMTDFVMMNGHPMLEVFRQLLVEALEKRIRADAAALVRNHGEAGSCHPAGLVAKLSRRAA